MTAAEVAAEAAITRELASQRLARTIRGECAERRISGLRLAQHLGLRQSAVSRRLTGLTPFTVNELDAVAGMLGMSLGELCANRDSNPEPAD